MEEAVDQIVDSAADMVVGRPSKPQLVHLAIVSAVAFGAGGGIAWALSKHHYKAKYEQLAEIEREETKAFYSQLYKKDEFATPGDAIETLGIKGAQAVEALRDYQGGGGALAEQVAVVEETVEVEVEPVETEGPTTSNIFTDRQSDMVWDQAKEDEYRAGLPAGEPYVISHMEFNENENDYDQKTLTYFAEDDVLVDEKDSPINLIDEIVGEGNLTRFGHGVVDNRIVHIRNDRLNMDFEIVKNDGSYSKLVLGFQHSDKPRVMRFRGGDE